MRFPTYKTFTKAFFLRFGTFASTLRLLLLLFYGTLRPPTISAHCNQKCKNGYVSIWTIQELAYHNVSLLYSTAGGQISTKQTSLEFQIMDPDSFHVLIALEILKDVILMLFSLIRSQWVDCALLFFSSSRQLTQAFSPRGVCCICCTQISENNEITITSSQLYFSTRRLCQ